MWISVAVLPSRSALQDLGLVLNWSSFCLKNLLFVLKSPKSQIFTCSAFHMKPKILLKKFLNTDYFQIKVDLPNVGIKFLEPVRFSPQNSKFGSVFFQIFCRSLV